MIPGTSGSGEKNDAPMRSMNCVLHSEVVLAPEQRELSCCLLVILEQVLPLGLSFPVFSHERMIQISSLRPRGTNFS